MVYLNRDEEEIARYWEEEEDWSAKLNLRERQPQRKGSTLWSDLMEVMNRHLHLHRPHVHRGA